MEYTRLMALDIGKKRIGIALSDPLMITAQGHSTYARKSVEDDIIHYNNLIKEYNVNAVVIGLPKTLSGEIGFAAQDILRYCDSIKDKLAAEIIMHDERMSSAHAHRLMDEGNVRHKNRRKSIDMLAASLILSDYMKGIQNGK